MKSLIIEIEDKDFLEFIETISDKMIIDDTWQPHYLSGQLQGFVNTCRRKLKIVNWSRATIDLKPLTKAIKSNPTKD